MNSVFDYIDWISQRVVVVYEDERESWLANRSNARSAKVFQILEGATVDVSGAERVIGYRLTGHHVAVVAWTHESGVQADQLSRSTRMIRDLAAEIGVGTPLVIGCDTVTSWGWVPVPRQWKPDELLDRWRWSDAQSPVLALGSCQAGVDGFRRSHGEALQVQRLASLGGAAERALVSYDEPGVATTSLLSHDLGTARAWIHDVLGDLARDDETAARFRRTLLTFLRHDMSYTSAAEAMVMHKNSIKYRVKGAETALGRPLADNRLSVELALTACDWLGQAVLRPGAAV